MFLFGKSVCVGAKFQHGNPFVSMEFLIPPKKFFGLCVAFLPLYHTPCTMQWCHTGNKLSSGVDGFIWKSETIFSGTVSQSSGQLKCWMIKFEATPWDYWKVLKWPLKAFFLKQSESWLISIIKFHFWGGGQQRFDRSCIISTIFWLIEMTKTSVGDSSYQIKRRPPSSVPTRASGRPSTGARALTQTSGAARCWGCMGLAERGESIPGQSGSNGEEQQVVSRYRQLSESVKSCSVEPAAECSEQTTLQADRATTAWTRPWQRSVWERLELDSILLTTT